MKVKRIMLKLSGESLAGEDKKGFSVSQLESYAEQIKEILSLGIEVSIVIGGGNIFRGIKGSSNGFDRVKGDQMGMLATVINSLALNSALESIGVPVSLYTSFPMSPIGEHFSKDKAVESLKQGRVVIVAGGTSNPYFTTDTASTLRAIELDVDLMLKGTRVDGVYSSDPEKDKTAVKFDKISYDEIYAKGLSIMDLTSFTLSKENNLKILVFNMDIKGNLLKVLKGDLTLGTVISN